MTREEAVIVLNGVVKLRTAAYTTSLVQGGKQNHGEEDFLDALYSAIDALREQPRWISVEERLPEDSRVYHVVCKYGPKCVVSSAKYKHGKWEEVYSRYPVSPWKVTHWMPLPKPPTEEEV